MKKGKITLNNIRALWDAISESQAHPQMMIGYCSIHKYPHEMEIGDDCNRRFIEDNHPKLTP